MEELLTLYKECFPHKDAEAEIRALGKNFKFKIHDNKSFIIYIVTLDEAEIIDIGTAPLFRNKGLAEKALTGLLAELASDNVRQIFLEVAENNLPAVNLYKKLGFVEYNRRKGYYAVNNNEIDAILMRKLL